MNEENCSESGVAKRSVFDRFVMFVQWLRKNWFRRIYMVSYSAPAANGGRIAGHQDIDLQYAWGSNRKAVAEYIADNTDEVSVKAVSINFVQRIGFVVFSVRVMTW